MGFNTKIEWADHTFNPWIGCRAISPACDHCYAEAWAKRYGRDFAKRTRTADANWREPLKWNKEAAETGVRYRVFCASLADVFDNEVPASWRVDLLRLIEQTPHLDWLLLTKRIGNVDRMLDECARLMPEVLMWPMPNVWIGATICNQEEADRDIPKLLATPAAKRFLSMEPLLGPVQLSPCWLSKGCGFGNDDDPALSKCFDCPTDKTRCAWPSQAVDWIIVGGESGHGARPMHPDWVRSLRDQCNGAGTAFHFKQWGEWAPSDAVLSRDRSRFAGVGSPYIWKEKPLGQSVRRLGMVGKKAAGRVLDGRTWDEVPA